MSNYLHNHLLVHLSVHLWVYLSIVYYLQQRHVMVERNVLLKGLQHPFLVGLHFSFQTPNMLFFVLDYVNGGEVCVLKLNSMLAVRQGERLKKKKNTQFCISTSCYKSFWILIRLRPTGSARYFHLGGFKTTFCIFFCPGGRLLTMTLNTLLHILLMSELEHPKRDKAYKLWMRAWHSICVFSAFLPPSEGGLFSRSQGCVLCCRDGHGTGLPPLSGHRLQVHTLKQEVLGKSLFPFVSACPLPAYDLNMIHTESCVETAAEL